MPVDICDCQHYILNLKYIPANCVFDFTRLVDKSYLAIVYEEVTLSTDALQPFVTGSTLITARQNIHCGMSSTVRMSALLTGS